MMLYELNDILFFVKSFKEPDKTIPNVPYDLTVSAGGGHETTASDERAKLWL